MTWIDGISSGCFSEWTCNTCQQLMRTSEMIMEKASRSLVSSLPDPGIKVGEKVPDFILKNAFGNEVSSSFKLTKGPVVLVFYRGAWCPFCNMHLHALQKSLAQFKRYGAQLVTITPQTPNISAEQIKKDGYPFEVLSDLDSKVMKDYKLYYELPDELLKVYKSHGLDIEAFNGKGRKLLPVPGCFVIDKMESCEPCRLKQTISYAWNRQR